MKARIVVWIIFMLAAGAAHAGNSFNVRCTYSHTLADDPIVYPGKVGEAMVHEFFGNTSTNANSTYDSLSNNRITTCDSKGDISAYWVPQLRRSSGVVQPDYQKTYYKNDQAVVPLQTIPPGLEMLAGDHMGTAPNPHINFLCRGGSYTTTAPTNCPVVTDSSGTYSQLDISVHFPDCWNGKTLAPFLRSDSKNLMSKLHAAAKGALNVAYRNSDGTCPAAYPVKIPELQVNVQYSLGNDPDLSGAQLSLDPIFQNGQWVPQWGSMYTAHGDFINAWHPESLQYIIDTCSNRETVAGTTCAGNIPTYYSKGSANVQLDSGGAVLPTNTTLDSTPGSIVLIKFPMPANLNDFPYSGSYLQTFGGNTTDTVAITLDLYSASTAWDDASNLPTAAACTSQRIGGIYLNNVQQVRNNDISSYIASQKAAGATQIALCIKNATGKTFQFSSREGSWAPGLYLK
jgi:hypothetical protein